MSRFIILILNTATFLAVLIINYLSATNLISPQSVGEISDRYPTAITPAGYAFSIWGLIYLLLFLFIGFHWYTWKKKSTRDLIEKIGYYFILSNLANALWVIAWVNNQIALSLIFILILLGSLFKIIQRLDLERWDAPPQIILFVWWPIVIYFGWALLATLLNITIFLASAGYDDVLWGAEVRGIVFILVGTLIYLYLIYKRNLRESALVGIWGFVAIAYKQAGTHSLIVFFAVSSSIVLFVNIIYHAYRNRSLSIFKKK